jgi:hypothetical protein
VGSHLLSTMNCVPDGIIGIVRPKSGSYFYMIFIAAIEYVSSVYSTQLQSLIAFVSRYFRGNQTLRLALVAQHATASVSTRARRRRDRRR